MNAIIEHKKEWHPDEEIKSLYETIDSQRQTNAVLISRMRRAIECLDADDAIGAYNILTGGG